MPCEGLPAHAVPDVPQFSRSVAGSRDEGTEVRRQGQTHDVTGVARENRGLLTRLNVPQCAGDKGQRVCQQRANLEDMFALLVCF